MPAGAGAATRPWPATRRRLSGPLVDRFDLRIPVNRPDPSDLLRGKPGESTAVVAGRVALARRRARARGVRVQRRAARRERSTSTRRLAGDAADLLERLVATGRLSGRGVQRVRRVALTLADLAGDDPPVSTARHRRRPIRCAPSRRASASAWRSDGVRGCGHRAAATGGVGHGPRLARRDGSGPPPALLAEHPSPHAAWTAIASGRLRPGPALAGALGLRPAPVTSAGGPRRRRSIRSPGGSTTCAAASGSCCAATRAIPTRSRTTPSLRRSCSTTATPTSRRHPGRDRRHPGLHPDGPRDRVRARRRPRGRRRRGRLRARVGHRRCRPCRCAAGGGRATDRRGRVRARRRVSPPERAAVATRRPARRRPVRVPARHAGAGVALPRPQPAHRRAGRRGGGRRVAPSGRGAAHR